MVFSGIPFLYYYLPIVLILYFAVPRKFKNAVLAVASFVFYAWGEPKFVIMMFISILQGYVFGILIEKSEGRKKKVFLICSIVISLGMLGYCKYTDFFIENINALTGASIPLLQIVLPIGISFYTFQILSYAVDIYRKDAPAQHNFIDLAAYIAMFPQLIAGPIVRYSDIAKQLKERTHTFEKISLGIRRFTIGLGKKILIANALGELCSTFKGSSDLSVIYVWMYAIAYTLHIYFDFSGYSDMAIGLGKIFGFDFLENFNYPYISKSATEFWRRWHMSLGSWFRDYVYIPLGGNRVSKWRHIFNIFVVWLCTGFWHGAAWTFIVWGLFFGVLLILEKQLLLKPLNKSKILCHIYVFFAVIISFVIFDAQSMKDALHTIGSMFGANNLPFVSKEAIYYLRSYAVMFIAAIIGSTPLVSKLFLKISNNEKGRKVLNVLEPVFIVTVILIVTAYIVDGSFNPFLYFRF
ncbi:MAG: MBOAT family protein [Lachnospiraceae bacterium]|nr:MBOAT family protein [Lachnospiraceae bacterium]